MKAKVTWGHLRWVSATHGSRFAKGFHPCELCRKASMAPHWVSQVTGQVRCKACFTPEGADR